jgi:predicted dehydrogenase
MVMKVGIVGCGYVFDAYVTQWPQNSVFPIVGITDIDSKRVKIVSELYGLRAYPSLQHMLSESDIDLVLNLTSIPSHYEVTKTALLAGKHVYSEKPLTTNLNDARELISIAENKGVFLSCAPCNALCSSMRTLKRAVRGGTIGDAKLVYAELDDNPTYLMKPEKWRSRSGAPWPYVSEYEQGCTYEHVGYHLSWLCDIFGPAKSVTAFSKCLVRNKTTVALNPFDTPDFSVACINFHSGVVARITCSIVAPLDHRIKVIGNRGVLTVCTYRLYDCPVYLEKFSPLSLRARKWLTVRRSAILRWLLGINGKKLPFVAPDTHFGSPSSRYGSRKGLNRFLDALRRREVDSQDKWLGIAELANALQEGRKPFPSHDFTLHITEMILAIQAAGDQGSSIALTTSFVADAPYGVDKENVEAYSEKRVGIATVRLK